jgi:prepilin peptidase CpaA
VQCPSVQNLEFMDPAHLTAAVSDVRQRRIPNALTYSSMIAGLALQTVLYGQAGLLRSLAGGLSFGGVFLVFYLIRAMGAGDVKLAAALGFIVGLPASVPLMFATAVAGGILAVLYMVRSGQTKRTLLRTLSVIRHHARHGLEAHPEVNLDNSQAARMPYGLAFAMGTMYWALSSLWR